MLYAKKSVSITELRDETEPVPKAVKKEVFPKPFFPDIKVMFLSTPVRKSIEFRP